MVRRAKRRVVDDRSSVDRTLFSETRLVRDCSVPLRFRVNRERRIIDDELTYNTKPTLKNGQRQSKYKIKLRIVSTNM